MQTQFMFSKSQINYRWESDESVWDPVLISLPESGSSQSDLLLTLIL